MLSAQLAAERQGARGPAASFSSGPSTIRFAEVVREHVQARE